MKHTRMTIALLSALVTITYPMMAGQDAEDASPSDIRSIVVDPSEKDIDIIVPDESIYGIAYGVSEDEFIERFGKPDGYIQLRNRKSGMLYGRDHIFIFTEGRLSGLRIDSSVIDWRLANQLQTNPWFNARKWRLDNGIKNEMSLDEVKDILGDNLKTQHHGSGYYYRVGKTTVHLNISMHYDRPLSGPPTTEQTYTERINGLFLEQD